MKAFLHGLVRALIADLRDPQLLFFVVVVIVWIVAASGSADDARQGALIFAAVSSTAAFLALRNARLAREETNAGRKLDRLERVGELVGELGERVGDASTRRGTLWFALAGFTQRKLLVALALVPRDEFPLPQTRRLVERSVDAKSAQSAFDSAKFALIEVAQTIEETRSKPR